MVSAVDEELIFAFVFVIVGVVVTLLLLLLLLFFSSDKFRYSAVLSSKQWKKISRTQ